MPDQRETGAPAPLNPIAALTLVLVFPGRTFRRLKERPHWIMPLLFVALCSMLSGAYAVIGGHLDGFLASMALRTGQDPSLTRSAFLASTVLSAVVGVPLVLLLEALFYKLAGLLRGGKADFGLVFSTIAYASVPVGLGALLIAWLMSLTGSHSIGANLSFLVDDSAHPVLWSIARQLDLFSLWFFVLLGIAAKSIFDLPKARARQVGLLFAAFYLLIMSVSGIGNATQFEDPYTTWSIVETDSAIVIHHSMDSALNSSAAQLADARAALPRVLRKAEKAVGLPGAPRIDVYLYASRDAKLALTDNGDIAHAVEWASAVHVAWVEKAELVFAREVAKVSAAASL
ncbi:YIP1 family protein, partial [bacterium]|nr:YIP1 family protein [bacterium]